jgi:D-3-phosphoglycerate dehydrogenase
MSTFRVLVSDTLSERGLEVFRRAAPRFELDYRPGLGKDKAAFLEAIPQYDALAIRSGTKVTAEVLERATRLKVVGRAGIGVDNVDKAAASQRGVVVMNTPDGNVITTAEHAIALMCSLARHIPQATASMKAGQWEKTAFQGRELFEKTLGVVGLGNIGKIVADRARGLRMKVIAYDPYVTAERARELGVELVELDALFARADIVTLHVPLLDATRNLVDAAAIARMKRGALLINAARGGLVDEAAAAEALRSGQLGGAAFDVFLEEPPPADHPLLGLGNVILTPHLGASTDEAQENVAVAVAEQIVEYLRDGTLRNALNAPSVSAELAQVIGPYQELARKLGNFAAQLHSGPCARVVLSFGGETAELRTEPIAVAALASVLDTHLAQPVNAINAPFVAKERGIEVVERKTHGSHDFVATVGVRLEGPQGATELLGAVFGASDARVVMVDGQHLEIVPEGRLLLTRHHDRPGIIGRIGTALGESDVNISRMVLGVAKGELARCAISIDSAAPDEAIAAIAAIEGIEQVRQIAL